MSIYFQSSPGHYINRALAAVPPGADTSRYRGLGNNIHIRAHSSAPIHRPGFAINSRADSGPPSLRILEPFYLRPFAPIPSCRFVCRRFRSAAAAVAAPAPLRAFRVRLNSARHAGLGNNSCFGHPAAGSILDSSSGHHFRAPLASPGVLFSRRHQQEFLLAISRLRQQSHYKRRRCRNFPLRFNQSGPSLSFVTIRILRRYCFVGVSAAQRRHHSATGGPASPGGLIPASQRRQQPALAASSAIRASIGNFGLGPGPGRAFRRPPAIRRAILLIRAFAILFRSFITGHARFNHRAVRTAGLPARPSRVRRIIAITAGIYNSFYFN